MAKHHHSDLPCSWLQNTKPYQLVPKNSIFWSSNFEKIPFLPLFLYIFCTKMTQMTQCHTYIYTWRNFYKKSKEQNGKTKKYLYMIYMGVTLWHLWHSRWRKSGTEKIFYIYIYIYINLPKLGFYGLDTVPFRPCIFTDFSLLYIFCTKMSYLSVLSYIYTYGRKIKK